MMMASSSLSSTSKISTGRLVMGVTAFLPIRRAKCQNEFRAAALPSLYPRPSAVPLGDLSYDRQPRARTLDLPSHGSLKQLKNAFGVLRRYARSTVTDHDPHHRTVFHRGMIGRDLHVGRLTIAAELQCIGNEVIDPLGRPCAVALPSGQGLHHSHRRTGLLDLVVESAQRLCHEALALDVLG